MIVDFYNNDDRIIDWYVRGSTFKEAVRSLQNLMLRRLMNSLVELSIEEGVRRVWSNNFIYSFSLVMCLSYNMGDDRS